MPSTAEISLQLDALAVEYFDVLSQIYSCNQTLENSLKDGFLLMAKARYTIGSNSVCRLQYNEQDMESALVHVTVSSPSTDSPAKFETDTDLSPEYSPSSRSPAQPESGGLRRRNVPNESGDSTVDVATNGIEELEVTEKVSSMGDDTTKKKKSLYDPLRWFSVLSPQVLKQSQSAFRQATDVVCQLATLRSKLVDIKVKYRSLLADKRLIKTPDVEVSLESGLVPDVETADGDSDSENTAAANANTPCVEVLETPAVSRDVMESDDVVVDPECDLVSAVNTANALE